MERQVVFNRAIQWVISVFNVLTHCCWHLKLSQRLQDSLVAPIAPLVYGLLCSLYPSEHEIIHSKFADLAPILVNSHILGKSPHCDSLDQKVKWLLTLCLQTSASSPLLTVICVYLIGTSIPKVLFSSSVLWYLWVFLEHWEFSIIWSDALKTKTNHLQPTQPPGSKNCITDTNICASLYIIKFPSSH